MARLTDRDISLHQARKTGREYVPSMHKMSCKTRDNAAAAAPSSADERVDFVDLAQALASMQKRDRLFLQLYRVLQHTTTRDSAQTYPLERARDGAPFQAKVRSVTEQQQLARCMLLSKLDCAPAGVSSEAAIIGQPKKLISNLRDCNSNQQSMYHANCLPCSSSPLTVFTCSSSPVCKHLSANCACTTISACCRCCFLSVRHPARQMELSHRLLSPSAASVSTSGCAIAPRTWSLRSSSSCMSWSVCRKCMTQAGATVTYAVETCCGAQLRTRGC